MWLNGLIQAGIKYVKYQPITGDINQVVSLLYACCLFSKNIPAFIFTAKFLLFRHLFVAVAANAFLLNCSALPADVISTVEFNQTGDLLATGDKGGRVVIFQRETEVSLQSHI